jgi:hypothetical protein
MAETRLGWQLLAAGTQSTAEHDDP